MQTSDNDSSSAESNDPRTPLHTAPLHPTTTARALTAFSKLPKPKLLSTRFPLSPSHLQTQSSPIVPASPLDWGGDEWNLAVEETKNRSPLADMSSRPTAEQDSLFEETESDDDGDGDDEILPKVVTLPVEEAARALQSAISFEAAFGEVASGGAEMSTTSPSATTESQEQEAVDTPQSSRPEHVAKVLGFDTDAKSSDSGSGQSVLEDSPTMLGESLPSSARTAKPTENTAASSSQPRRPSPSTIKPLAGTGRAAQPKRHLPTTLTPLAGTARAAKSTKNPDDPSSQIVLRGLIRGAHREMMYFTLSHEGFSLDDLRQGLGFAFSVLAAAQSKQAILAILHDDMTGLSAAHLRSWMTQIDRIHPQTRHEPRMFVMFESLSPGEIRVALAEVVQSRLIVEDEVKRTKTLLIKRLAELESNAKSPGSMGAWSDVVSSLQNEFAGTAEGLLGEKEADWDAVLTAVMAVMIVGFYLCVRE
jgi:hypothetical protein